MYPILGIDPGQRRTGICLNDHGRIRFTDIRTDDETILESGMIVAENLHEYLLNPAIPLPATIAVEKQLSAGAESSALMFHMQMIILAEIRKVYGLKGGDMTFISPLPVQLKSYMKKTHGVATATDTGIVRSATELSKTKERISSHKAIAYFLTRFAEDVIQNGHTYKLPTREPRLHTWKLTGGV
jgi:hypothetical protein